MIEQEFRALFDSVSTWGGFETHPERGALNHLTPERVVAAARLVRRCFLRRRPDRRRWG